MVKPPKIRHSKPRRDPVTIDLEPESVSEAKPMTADTTSDTKSGSKADIGVAAQGAAPESAPKPQAAKPETGLLDASPEAKREPPKPSSTPAGTPTFGRGPDAAKPADAPRTDDKAKAGAAAAPPPKMPDTTIGKDTSKDKAAPRRGGMPALAAALIGGMIALGGAVALQQAGILPAPRADTTEIDSLRAEIAALRDEAGNAAPAVDTELGARVEALAAELQALREAGPAAVADDGQAAALEQRLAALESSVAALPREAGAGEAPDLGPLESRIATVEGRFEPLTGGIEENRSALAALGDRLGALEERLGQLAATVDEQATQPGVALAIAASALKAAIDRGDRFMTELETYAAVAPDSAEIAPLRDMAASGVPTRTAIAADFPDAAAAMIAAGRAEAPDAGFLDKLMSSAQSLVQVRPVGMVEGESVPAIVARMEVAIGEGDYARALAEYDRLPEAAKAASADYVAGIRARQAADALVETIVATALKS